MNSVLYESCQKELNRRPFSNAWLLPAAFAIAVTISIGQRAVAQASGEGEDTISVQGYAVFGYKDGIQTGYGWYQTQAEAEAERQRMLKQEIIKGKMWDKVTIVSETRTLPKSTYLPKLQFKPNRKAGDVVKEYKAVLKKARDNVMQLKSSLTSRTGQIATKDFNDINKLIADFNEMRNDAISTSGDAFKDIPSIPPVKQQELAGNLVGGQIQTPELGKVDLRPIRGKPDEEPSLAGQVARGTIGNLKAVVMFSNKQFVVRGEIDGDGTYEQFGNDVVLRTNTSEYRGKIDGKSISGVRNFIKESRPKERWSLELKTEEEEKKLAEVPSLVGTSWRHNVTEGYAKGYSHIVKFGSDGVYSFETWNTKEREQVSDGTFSVIKTDEGVLVTFRSRNGNYEEQFVLRSNEMTSVKKVLRGERVKHETWTLKRQ